MVVRYPRCRYTIVSTMSRDGLHQLRAAKKNTTTTGIHREADDRDHKPDRPKQKKAKTAKVVDGSQQSNICLESSSGFPRPYSPQTEIEKRRQYILNSFGATARMEHPVAGAGEPEGDLDAICSFLADQPHHGFDPTCEALLEQQLQTTVVRRAWEERFLHEASGNERRCANARTKTCFAGRIFQNGMCDKSLSLTEFYTESEYKTIENNGWVWPEQRRECLLCMRNTVFSKFMYHRCNNKQASQSVVFSPIANIVGEAGEYCLQDVFCTSPVQYEGVVLPVVIPCIDDYAVVKINGVRHLRQLLPVSSAQRADFFF